MHTHFQKFTQNLELNPSFDAMIQTRHTAVRNQIAPNAKLIGSLQRKTRIQPRPGESFDIDILVILGQFDSWATPGQGVTAPAALNGVYGRIQGSDRYATKQPQQDAPSITMRFANNVTVELVPAYLDNIGHNPQGLPHFPKGRAYWIPDNRGGWQIADYDYDADYITQQNKASDGYLVPVIKMLKAAKRLHFPTLKSFALEILAAQNIPLLVSFLKQRGHPITYPVLLYLFFSPAADRLPKPIHIPSSHSPAIILTPFDVSIITNKFTDIATVMTQANSATTQGRQVELWRAIFGDAFPFTV